MRTVYAVMHSAALTGIAAADLLRFVFLRGNASDAGRFREITANPSRRSM
jgi:hypothetical protein